MSLVPEKYTAPNSHYKNKKEPRVTKSGLYSVHPPPPPGHGHEMPEIYSIWHARINFPFHNYDCLIGQTVTTENMIQLQDATSFPRLERVVTMPIYKPEYVHVPMIKWKIPWYITVMPSLSAAEVGWYFVMTFHSLLCENCGIPTQSVMYNAHN